MTEQKWCELCIAIAKSDEHTFADLFEVAKAQKNKIQEKEMAVMMSH